MRDQRLGCGSVRRLAIALGILLIGMRAGIVVGQPTNAEEPLLPRTSEGTTIPIDRVTYHVPDPELNWAGALELLEQARRERDQTLVVYLERVMERVRPIRRPHQVRLTLEEALLKTLGHSFAIDVQRYNPAVESTRLVEAEAAFDAIFFASASKNNIDRPSGSQLLSTDVDISDVAAGISKLAPTGATLSATYRLTRTRTALAFQQINPEYFMSLALEARQPLLRGFGLDYNRSLILITGNDRRISTLALERQVQDVLRLVEELYWRLVQARRDVVIVARQLAEFEGIFDYLESRKDFDIMPVQLAATKANLEQARAEFVQVRANLFNAEDRLIAALNDPQMNLAEDIEIIPTEYPQTLSIQIDRLAEAQAALDHRQEIGEQQLRVATAKLAVGRAKNEELPRMDLTFRSTFDGLGISADEAVDQLTQNNFIEYFIGIEFELPIGNRARRAAHLRSLLQHRQAIAQLKDTFEQVLLDVNLAVRQLGTSFDQIAPAFESAEAREREVEAIVARAERKDFNTLNSELNARQSLANSRRALIGAMVDYNIAIVNLERAKGTLLDYYNVIVPAAQP